MDETACDPEFLKKMNRFLREAPFHRWLGLEITFAVPGRIEMILPFREELIVNEKRRYVHGGILGTIIDVAGDMAVSAQLGYTVPTVDMRIDYHRAAGPVTLRTVGEAVRVGRAVGVADAWVYDPEGRLLASGRGVYSAGTPENP